MVLEIEGLNYIWSITCPTCPCDMFDMFLWYVRHVPLVCSTCSFDMFSMFLQYVQHAHNTCSSCKNYMYLHVLPHVPCSMCMFFSGGPLLKYTLLYDVVTNKNSNMSTIPQTQLIRQSSNAVHHFGLKFGEMLIGNAPVTRPYCTTP